MLLRTMVVMLLGWILTGIASAATPLAVPTANATPPAVDISRELPALLEADWIARDRLFAAPVAAPVKKTVPSTLPVTTAEDAAGGCDGIKTGAWGFHTQSGETDPWWQVDLGRVYRLDRVLIFNRCDKPSRSGFKFQLQVAEEAQPRQFRTVYQHNGAAFSGVKDNRPLVVTLKDQNIAARIVRLFVPGKFSFALDEVEVYAVDDPHKNVALKRPAEQKSVGKWSTRPSAKQTPTPVAATASPAFSLAHTRAILDRAAKLAARLAATADHARLAPLQAEVAKLQARLAELQGPQETPEPLRRDVYFAACKTARQIAFCNPLLTSVERLLFIKRHDAQGVIHMCDQFYGCNAKPGGGLFVLEQPFGVRPKLRDLLAQSVVEQGRLAGKSLQGGSFLSPDLSFDGRTILFAYTQAEAYAKSQGKETYLWSPEYSFHLFKVNTDGSGLVQLTDGAANDFDPCFLPGGRVAFISERRGGYLRCGRHCPVYTLFSMRPDGSDIFCLSYHETHEWQPSVDHNGMLVYTRWDYVDRDTNIAHHMWTSYPDGRDPRSFHGNYPQLRESRPWMEMDIRAIPGSHKYVATAAGHHGHALGSLVLIDPRVPDDGSMSQLTRLTPEAPFPEAEKGPMAYATAWPLSEDDYLCVYDPAAKNHGLYWIDRFGNKELLYRDPTIACFSPIPLRARPMPPVLPDRTTQAADAQIPGRAGERATIAVMNVYNSDFSWPAGVPIKALRVIQVLPKSTAPPNVPRVGVATQTNARAVLGTVPVEHDGSAYFEAPPGKAIYFQALDEQGLAVQSMRSATYVHPGEQLVCQGCHESKQQPPASRGAMPLALRRAPSTIVPDVAGSKPFSYVRLVQPVLDRHCVACHVEKKALDLSGAAAPKTAWTQSYANLAGKYGFYYHVGNGSIKDPLHGGSRSTAGKIGARASKLLAYLDAKHYNVQLSAEEFHRVALWLDCNSEFLGAYEKPLEQARGEVVTPSLE